AFSYFCRLPPGPLDSFDRAMHADQLYCIKKAEVFGPIFKTMWNHRYTTCMGSFPIASALNRPPVRYHFARVEAFRAPRSLCNLGATSAARREPRNEARKSYI